MLNPDFAIIVNITATEGVDPDALVRRARDIAPAPLPASSRTFSKQPVKNTPSLTCQARTAATTRWARW